MNEKEIKWFGEYAIYYTDEEKEQAQTYLKLWMKFHLRRLSKDSFDVEVVDEQWVDHPNGALKLSSTLGLKIKTKAKWKYELE